MAIDNFTKSGIQSFTDASAWTGGVPGSTTDAEINDSAIVGSGSNETVKSIGTGSGNVLNINGGIFDAFNGTGLSTNSGIIAASGATFEVSGGTENNPGKIELMGSGAALVFPTSNVTLDGGGSIQMTIGGGPNSNKIQSGNVNAPPTLTNQDNTISGDGTIGAGLDFINDGTVETNNSTSSSPGTLAILGTAGIFISNSGNFVNNNLVQVDSGGTVILGVDNVTGSIDNEANIDIDANTFAATELKIAGNMTITATGNGSITMGGANAQSADGIVSDGNPATLTLVNQTITGAGFIGDFDLTLDNQSGTINAAGGELFLYSLGEGPTIQNAGTLEAISPSGTLVIEQNVNNTGTIAAANGGLMFIDGNVSGSGSIDIGVNGSISISNPGEVANNITFTGGGGFLQLNSDSPNGGLSGEIIGAAGSDEIDLTSDITPYSASNHLSWQQTSTNGGVLSLLNSSNATIISLNLAGSYTTADFSLSADDLSPPDQGTLITVLNPPPPASTTADMIMRNAGNGDYEIYDLGNNGILGAYPLGQVGSEWQVAGLGGFNGSDTTDMILRDSNNGDFEVYDISNNNITNAVAMGQVGLEWTASGFGDFSSKPGETDMLMRNSNTGQFEVYDISNNQITSAAAMGQVGLEWTVAGFGDFSGHTGETGDMLMRNGNTGQFEVYDVANNQITSAGPMGQVGLEWTVAGFGDFSGNANETDMLMRNSNTGAFELYDISGNSITNAMPMGQVGLEWQVVGFGPINGGGASDMLMRNSNTGAFEIYDIANNQITNATSMGQVGLEWSVAGIAADPPGMAPANAQLVQAMANYAANDGGAADTASLPAQGVTQPAGSNVFAAANEPPRPA